MTGSVEDIEVMLQVVATIVAHLTPQQAKAAADDLNRRAAEETDLSIRAGLEQAAQSLLAFAQGE